MKSKIIAALAELDLKGRDMNVHKAMIIVSEAFRMESKAASFSENDLVLLAHEIAEKDTEQAESC